MNTESYINSEDSLSQTEINQLQHNNCCLCGGSLKFKHDIDYAAQTIKEQAQCPNCQINLVERSYRLQ